MATRSDHIEITGTPYCYESAQQSMIFETAERVQELRSDGKLSPEVLSTIRKYFRIKDIYHSNAIEGNILDVGETRQVVEYGLTITGKPLKDQAEAKNLAEALSFLESLVSNSNQPIMENDVRQLHYLVLKDIDDQNAGKYRTKPVEISGSNYKPPSAEFIPSQMNDFGDWLKKISIHPGELGSEKGLLYAAVAHTWFVYIHPFIDGNGRVARLLMNLILMRYGYPIAIIAKEDRYRYYDSLEFSQVSDLSSFIALLTECVHESLEEYEFAAEEQRERKEWAASLAERFSERERIKAKNMYEVWKSAMDLLKGYFRQTSEYIGSSAKIGNIYFRDFGTLEFEKYLSLNIGESAKKTWFFRLDFISGDRAIRYLFFFGSPSHGMRTKTDVTLHIAREEPEGSYRYQRLEMIEDITKPLFVEIGYRPDKERFIAKTNKSSARMEKIDDIGRKFFEDVINNHFKN